MEQQNQQQASQKRTLTINGEDFKVTFKASGSGIIEIIEVWDTHGFKQDLNNLENHNGIISKMVNQLESDLKCGI